MSCCDTTLMTLSQPFRKARLVNQTSTGFVSKIPTLTEPTGDAETATGASIIELNKGGKDAQNGVLICPYGLHASIDNKTLAMRVIGWRFVPGVRSGQATTSQGLWIPVPLVEIAGTCSGTPIGVAGGVLGATEGFCDTITLTGTTANANVGVEIVSPANDTIAHMIVDMKGFQKLELSFHNNSSATSVNALLALL